MAGCPLILQNNINCPAQLQSRTSPCCGSRCRSAGPDAGSRSADAAGVACRAAVLDYEAPTQYRPPPSSGQVIPNATSGRLINSGSAFVESHRIRAYECGPDQKTTIITMSNILQEVAGNHGVSLWGRTEAGFATDPVMVELSLIFVSTRIQIQMDAYPRWGDEVEIETWFQAEGRIGACRNWLIRDKASGQQLGQGTSTWVMLNTSTRRLAKIPDKMRHKLDNLAPHPFRFTIPAAEARLKIPDMTSPPEMEAPKQVARRSDMDMNGHINNVTYLGWALETVPPHIADSSHLFQVEIDFKNECMAGDAIESLSSRVDEHINGTGVIRYNHWLKSTNSDGTKELVRARSTWKPDSKAKPRH